MNSVTKVSPATAAASVAPSPTIAASSPHTPLKFKNCSEAGIASGDKVAYNGREFWAKPSGSAVLLFDTPTMKGAHVHAPNINSVIKASRTVTPPPAAAAAAAAPAAPTTPNPARKLTFDGSTMHVDAIDPRTRELPHPTLLKLTKKTLGAGSSGNVVEGVLANEVTDEVQRVAVKLIALAGDDVSAPRREIDALIAAADIDSIAPLLCWSLDRATKTLSIVTHLFEGGNLHKLLHSLEKQKRLLQHGEPLMLRFAYQVARGVYLLHSRSGSQMCHFDLKPENVVLTSRDLDDAHAVIVDLGSARIFAPDKQHTITALGSEAYMAPECHFSAPAGTAADVWSLGVMLWEMFQVWPDQANRPRPSARPLSFENVQQRTFPNDLGTVPNGAIRALIARCTTFDPPPTSSRRCMAWAPRTSSSSAASARSSATSAIASPRAKRCITSAARRACSNARARQSRPAPVL